MLDLGIKIWCDKNAGNLKYQTEGASGVDLPALEDYKLQPGEIVLIRTGIYMIIPYGYEGQIRPRSGLSSKGVIAILGSLDSDYRGEVKVILLNKTNKVYEVKRHDRIAQVVFAPIVKAKFIKFDDFKEWSAESKTMRGDNGFGHTK